MTSLVLLSFPVLPLGLAVLGPMMLSAMICPCHPVITFDRLSIAGVPGRPMDNYGQATRLCS